MIPWLTSTTDFPSVMLALQEPNGLLAAGGMLNPDWLIAAYQRGIFPWFNEGQPILWWSPDPRMVLFPSELHVPKSLARVMRKGDYEIRVDTVFEAVMTACSLPRHEQSGSWISTEMVAAYTGLHHLGLAHSVETWQHGELVGGLYGVALGQVFYGESMFAKSDNASKIAFVHLVQQLRQWDFKVIDCQMNTAHLARFGAREIARADFMQILQHNEGVPSLPWQFTER